MLTQRPRGTSDILSPAITGWQVLEDVARTSFELYGFEEIRTPIFEHTEVFERGVGETTDIVEKEMYTFRDRGDRSITLRPEGTAGVIRAFIENKLYGRPDTVKLYYIGPMFRYEKPQKGRERQFHQFGCEVLGSDGPAIDAEVIELNVEVLRRFGLRDLTVELNSVGCADCRPLHKQKMVEALRPVADQLCKDCQHRLERNPLRIFDCKNGCRALLAETHAPTIRDCLCDACTSHLAGLEDLLKAMEVPYEINDFLVRGLDYYTRTAWEVTSPGFGTICGGGRYNGLVAQLGGPDTPGIGFAVGMERALLLLAEQSGRTMQAPGLQVFVAVADEAALIPAAKLLQTLRRAGIRADRDYQGKGLKAQFKAADRAKAEFVAVLGETELQKGTVTVKQMASGEQHELTQDELVAALTTDD